jgi:mono/diheme cytochrome c family protein
LEVAVPGKSYLKITLVVLVSLVLCFTMAAQGKPAQGAAQEYKVPPEDVQKPNPVKATPESINRGKKLYNVDCSLCHGEKGDGKGDMASDIKNITDFTNSDVQKSHTDGEWFYIVRKGKGEMPPEDAGRAKDDDVWSIVNYLRTFGKK